MKIFFRKNKSLILGGVIVFFACLTVGGYFYPESIVGNVLRYYNGISSLIIVLLTLVYVITTNRQLFTMQKQLDIMDSSIRLQVQPLPVPSVKNVYLERIRPYKGPETKFEKIHFLSRFHFEVDFKNAGTGAALNITVFASILLKRKEKEDKEIEIPETLPKQIYLIIENESQSNSIMNSFMILDNEFEIFKALSTNEEVDLKLRIYYKNIFGSGFLEEAEYSLTIEDKQDDIVKAWTEFLTDGINSLSKDVIRFELLVSKLPKEAELSFENIKNHMKERYDKDIKLRYLIEASSFNVRIVDFEESLKLENVSHINLLKSFHPDTYKLIADKSERK